MIRRDDTARPGAESGAPGSTPGTAIGSLLRAIARLPEPEPRAPEPDRTGQRVGHFSVLEKLGQGGMGTVYLAEDLRLNRLVALKVLRVALAASDVARQRFLCEARTAASVVHPNLATVFDIGESDGATFIALEHIHGIDLRRRLARSNAALAPQDAAGIALAVACGVARAHERGIVHRDLKPENIMLAHDGCVKVIDFGLATESGSPGSEPTSDGDAGRCGRICGTFGYMAPEQSAGEPVDPRADVYSLGMVLHEMLTGARPPRAGPRPEWTLGIEARIAAACTSTPSGELRRFTELVERCVRVHPDERPPDCRALVPTLTAAREALAACGRTPPEARS